MGRRRVSRERGSMELKAVALTIPKDGNIIVGQSHFIKTVEDIYEAIVNTSPHIKFGLAFNEASGPCLTRVDGNDQELQDNAIANATAIGAGHVFCIALRGGFPINVLPRIREYLDAQAGYQTNRYPNLSPELRAEITRRWGPVIERYGYAPPP